jgi:Na+-transporting NADH:ubiquinone oxidoreductase subunit NqrD
MPEMNRNNHWSEMFAAHPARISALGILPLVAPAYTLAGSTLTGFGFLAVLLLSSVSLSLMRNLIPHKTRLVYILLITAMWVTVLDQLLQVYLFELSMQVGIYLPLLALNSFLLMVMEKEALTRPAWPLMASVLKLSLMPVSLCLANGLVREWLVFGHLISPLQGIMATRTDYPVSLPLFATAIGAFVVTGCLLALVNLLMARPVSAPAGNRQA